MFCQTIFGKKRNHYYVWEEIIFPVDFGENLQVEKLLPNELVCIFTKHYAYCCKSLCLHLRSSSVTMYEL
jgi:hypothetical protein